MNADMVLASLLDRYCAEATPRICNDLHAVGGPRSKVSSCR
jgi:hypothetical protein